MRVIRSTVAAAPPAVRSPAACAADSQRRELAPRVPPLQIGLVFDVANVLYDATMWRRWLLRLVNSLGVRASYDGFYRRWDRKYLPDVHCGRREFHEAFQSFLLSNNLSWAQIDEVEAASLIQRKNLEANVRPLPGVIKTMARLAELAVPMLAIADSPHPAVRLSDDLERLGLANRFETVLSSFDLEAVQPSTHVYRTALKSLGTPAENTVYVGHDARHLAGTKAVGMRTAAFNFEPSARADFYLTRFEDLADLIEQGPFPSRPNATAKSRT